MKVSLSLTHNCNFRCRYCYAGRKYKADMPLETAKQVVDLAIEKSHGEMIDFSFFGGEPLLKFELIKQISSYIHSQTSRSSIPYRLGITTNGSILNQEILNFFKEQNFSLCFSLDGPEEIHNKNRIQQNGKGSYKKVINNLKWACEELKNIQVNAVYNRDSLPHLNEILKHIASFRIRAIHLNLDIHEQWQKADINKFEIFYQELADSYIQSYQQGKELALNLLDNKMILFLKDGYSRCDKCGMGDSEWAVAPSGNIYPCERLIGEDNGGVLCIGEVKHGFDAVRKSVVTMNRGNFNTECTDCSQRNFCMNWCGCTNYNMTGHTGIASAALCASERAAIKASKYVFLELNKQGNDLFKQHLMGYLSQGGKIH